MHFHGIYLVGKAGQRHAINRQLLKVVIRLQLYGVVWCLRISNHIAEGNSVLTKNCRQVVLECPGPCDTVFVPLRFPGSAALLRLADSSRLCFMILDICLAASTSVQNSTVLLMMTSEGVWLTLMKSWAKCIFYFRRLVPRKPKLILPVAIVLSENPLARMAISESPSTKMS